MKPSATNPDSSRPALTGLLFEPRKVIADERGRVLHYLRTGSPLLPRFGEVYVSTILPGAVKAWKRHHRVAQNLIVPAGCIRFVAYDDRPESATRGRIQELRLDTLTHGILHVPAGLWYGFQGLAPGESVIVNCISEIHDPAESDRLPEQSSQIPYQWPVPNP
ncbi:MAG: cupin domain-containing protein [Opitutales bacterium]